MTDVSKPLAEQLEEAYGRVECWPEERGGQGFLDLLALRNLVPSAIKHIRQTERERDEARAQALEEAEHISKARFKIGDRVEKYTGDYSAFGVVRSAFVMENGALRYVVEHKSEGGGSFCHIYSEKNLRKIGDAT